MAPRQIVPLARCHWGMVGEGPGTSCCPPVRGLLVRHRHGGWVLELKESKAVLCSFHPLRSSFAGLTFKCFSFWGECSQGLVRHGCSSR